MWHLSYTIRVRGVWIWLLYRRVCGGEGALKVCVFLYFSHRKKHVNQNLNVKGVTLNYENSKIVIFIALKCMILEEDTRLHVYSYSRMYTIQINRILFKHLNYFQEVYPVDLLLSTLLTHIIIVINLSKNYISCSHCLDLCFRNTEWDEYFDSYDLPPYKLEIMAYLHRHSISCEFNCYRLKGLTANNCGHYCHIYAFHRAKGLSVTSFVNMFLPPPYTFNDIRPVSMFRDQFGQCPACSQLEQQQSCKSQI